MCLPSLKRVIATARRPLARRCASEGRYLFKMHSNQWNTLIEGLNGPSLNAFICLAKWIISSRMVTVKIEIFESELIITFKQSRFRANDKVTYLGSYHRPQQPLPEIQQMHREQTVLRVLSRGHSSASTGQPPTGRWPWIQIQRRRWMEELRHDYSWELPKPFSKVFQLSVLNVWIVNGEKHLCRGTNYALA